MARSLPPLGGLRAFEAAARLGSLRAAAQELGVTPGAVSQQVKGLETHLSVRLFDRGAHSLSLTSAGQRYLPVLRDSFDAIAAATQGLGKPSPQAVVELTMPAIFAQGWMLPRLERFRALHREVDLRLRNSHRLLTPGTENVVAAIRHGRAGWDPLTCLFLFCDALVAVCHPAVAANLARAPGGRTSLEGATLLTPEDGGALWPEWQRSADVGGQGRSLVLGDESLVLQAALNRLGLALVDAHLVEEPLRLGQLVQPFDSAPWRRGTAWYLVHANDPEGAGSVDIVWKWLLEETSIPIP